MSTSDEESAVDIKPTKSAVRGGIDGLGKFLFQMHSSHYSQLTCAKEEVTLQFYEHVVIADVTTKLWCFPKSSKKEVIPRYKIIDASFSFGPKKIPWMAWLLLLVAVILVSIGMANGGCRAQTSSSSSYNYYSSSYNTYSYSSYNPGACALSVIGFLIMFIPVPVLLFLPCILKKHHVYFEVKATPWPKSRVRSVHYDFRFKKVGFENAASNNAVFDELYLINYVFGALGKHGTKVMEDYHLLSHFNHVNLTDPIKPFHADDSILDIVSTVASSAGRAPTLASSIHSTGTDSGHHSHSVHQSTNSRHRKRQSKSIDV